MNQPNLESRQYLQAWHMLRQLGVQPEPPQSKQVYGVVVQVHLEDGLDTVAAYTDHSARYFNHGGKIIVWEADDASISALIDEVLVIGQRIANAIGPWEAQRPAVPRKGNVRLNMLTPSGLHFGEAPFEALNFDPMGGPLVSAAKNLMAALIERATAAS